MRFYPDQLPTKKRLGRKWVIDFIENKSKHSCKQIVYYFLFGKKYKYGEFTLTRNEYSQYVTNSYYDGLLLRRSLPSLNKIMLGREKK